jgi:hypothetical protein
VDDVSVEEPAEEDSATAEETAPAEDTDAEESRQDDR